MLLIIVGAGASYDSDWRRLPLHDQGAPHDGRLAGTYFRPPLAAELFDEDRFGGYVAEYRPSKGLMVRLRAAAPAVEEELERIRNESRTQEQIPRQLLAVRYYLRAVIDQTVEEWTKAKPDRITNFTRLLTALEPWRQRKNEQVAIVTFNYDTMFDAALTDTLPHFQLRQMGDYIADNRYKLFKLHGSIDWWRDVSAEWIRGDRSASPASTWAYTMFDPPGQFIEDGAFHLGEGGYHAPCVPSLALPMATKGDSDFACPKEHLEALRQQLDDVSDVLIIGWRGIEQHFFELWRLVHATHRDPAIRTIAVVDRTVSAGQDITARVTHNIGLRARDLYYETFSTFVNEKLDEYITFL